MFESRTIPIRKTKLNAYGEGRVQTAPMARLQKKSRRQSPQVRAEHPAFPARWHYGLYVVSSVRRAFWPPSRADHHRPLGISVGMPGPHDFAVRIALFVRSQCKLQHDAPTASPVQRFVTTREAPL
jgi:hypothetical protein